MQHYSLYLTHYSLVLLFYTPWKHQKTFRFSVFRGYKKATPGCNGLNKNSTIQETASIQNSYPADNYMFKVNNKNTGTRRETCSELAMVLVSLLLTLNMFHTLLNDSIVTFEQVKTGWVMTLSNIYMEFFRENN